MLWRVLRDSPVEPEVYFRIVHSAQYGHKSAPVAVFRVQAIEIALGTKGAFENGNIGALTRRVATDQVVSAVQPRRGKPNPPKEPRTPRVVELLRTAIEWRRRLDGGEVQTQADIARREGITRARLTQIMGMLRLNPETLKKILSLPPTATRPSTSERALRLLRKRAANTTIIYGFNPESCSSDTSRH